MRPQQKKSHPHRILPPALHRQQLRAALRRELEAEARAMREEERLQKSESYSFWEDMKENRYLIAQSVIILVALAMLIVLFIYIFIT